MKNKYEIREKHAVVFVNCKGETLETLISLEDLERVKLFPYTWYAHYNKRRNVYIVSGNFGLTEEGRKRVLLSRWIMNPSEKLVVDHVNHNTLDNRRVNLRVITDAENHQNLKSVNKNGIPRGVHQLKRSGKWAAYLTINNERIHLGKFNTMLEANEAAQLGRKFLMPYSQENLLEG
jgi:hypothetical protein